MTQAKEHRDLFLTDLEWTTTLPILSYPFKLCYRAGQPQRVAFWSAVGEERNERLDGTVNARVRLAEWRSSDIPYIVNAIAPAEGFRQLKIAFQKGMDGARDLKGLAQ